MFNEKGKKFIMQNIKKINKLGILFGIILLLLITLTGCSFEEEEGLRTTINKLMRTSRHLLQENRREPTLEEIAKELEISIEKVL